MPIFLQRIEEENVFLVVICAVKSRFSRLFQSAYYGPAHDLSNVLHDNVRWDVPFPREACVRDIFNFDVTENDTHVRIVQDARGVVMAFPEVDEEIVPVLDERFSFPAGDEVVCYGLK
jgi:hypothetical protein